MAFRILKKHKELGMNSLYAFETEPIDGRIYYREFNTKEDADKYVEKQLNAGVPKTSIEVVAHMKYTISASIDEEECGCGIPSTNPKPTEKAYQIIANPIGGVVERGTRITFVIDGDRNKFTKLKIDGTEIKSDYYTVTAGSTIISLVGIYADTLSLGEHTIEFIFTDGKAEDKFEIVEKSEGGEDNTGGSEDIPSDNPSGEPSDTPSDEPGDTSGDSEEPDDSENPGESINPEPETPPEDNNEDNTGENESGEGTTNGEETPPEGNEEGTENGDSETESTDPTVPADPEDTSDSENGNEESEEATTDDVVIPGFDGL